MRISLLRVLLGLTLACGPAVHISHAASIAVKESGDFTIAPTDCNKAFFFSSTSQATVTVARGSEFPANCRLRLVNTGVYTGPGSARGLLLGSISGATFPNQGDVLYPGQQTEFVNVGSSSAWIETGYDGRKRWHPTSVPTFFVDCAAGSDSTADGLGTGSGANATLANGYWRLSVFADYSNGLQPRLSSTGSCPLGDGIHMAGPVVGATGNAAMKWNGNGTTTVHANAGTNCASLFNGAILEVDNVTCINHDSTGCWSVAAHSVLFFITAASSCDPGPAQGYVVSDGGSKIEFVDVGLTFGGSASRSPVALFSVSNGGAVVFDTPETITFAGDVAFSAADIVAYGFSLLHLAGVTFNLNGHAVTGTRFICQEFSVIRGTSGMPNTFIPGDANGSAGRDCETP